jgi:hypothetical protein
MKKIIAFFILIAAFSVAYSTATVGVKPPVKANEVYLPLGKTGQLISLQELSSIKLKDFEKLTGKEMKFFDKLNFKLGQRQLKKSINADGTFSKKKVEKYFSKAAEGGGGFNAGGFFLGLLLGLIGVLIAYLIKDDKKRNRVKWAWIGWGVWVVILVIILASGGSVY